jgi:hypothetical protein
MTQRQLATLASMLTPASPRAPRPLTERAEQVAA